MRNSPKNSYTMTGEDRRDRRRAVIIGGSMAGLFTALLLRRAGWHVDVFERIGTELAGRGAGRDLQSLYGSH